MNRTPHASQERWILRLMLPYCLHIGASEEEIFTSFSGSASCPVGSAVSGWYNLPGVPVQMRDNSIGGPSNLTGLQLFLGGFIFCLGFPIKFSSL